MSTTRQSNMELLRIVSMLAVIMVHLDGASLGLPIPGGITGLTASDAWKTAVESITIVGVNCFTLISGFFGIRAKVSGFVKFTLMCVFYSVIIYVVTSVGSPSGWSDRAFLESFMVFTHTDLWYVPAYMLLYLLSPMLNGAIKQLPLRRFSLWLGLFIAANIWCGWYWGANFNPTGYTPMQLIMMYCIGRWIAVATPRLNLTRKGSAALSLGVYVVSTLVTAIAALYMPAIKAYAYNSPWVITSSVALFMFFATLKIQSATINEMAKGAFAAYLIHKNPQVWTEYVRPAALEQWRQGSLLLYTLFTLGFSIFIYTAATLADSFRRWLFGQFETLFDNKVKVEP